MSLADDYVYCLVPLESVDSVGGNVVCVVCGECGAVVADRDQHAEHHSKEYGRMMQ